jgi:hypothetical protein
MEQMNKRVRADLGGTLKAGGNFSFECYRRGKLQWVENDCNLLPNEHLDHVLNVVYHGTTPVSPWYVGLFEGNYTPLATVTAASVTADSTECTAYDEATRVAYDEAAASSQSLTNSASKATFTINATKTLYGAFMSSASAKSATTGTIGPVTRFSTSRAVIDNDVILVTYTITAASA